MKHLLSILAFMVVSFGVQGLSHFVLNKAHFAKIGFIRPHPILWMGISVMLLQGLVMSLAMGWIRPEGATIADGLMLAAAFGLFLASYIAVVEPSKYTVPSVIDWVRVEASASIIQFALFGLLLGFIHSTFS